MRDICESDFDPLPFCLGLEWGFHLTPWVRLTPPSPTGFLNLNQAMLGALRSCDLGSDEYGLLESESGDVRYATVL